MRAARWIASAAFGVAALAVAAIACSSFEETAPDPADDAGGGDGPSSSDSAGPPPDTGVDARTDGGSDPVRDIVAGGGFGCAIRMSGTLTCWGTNDVGTMAQPPTGDLACDENTHCRLPAPIPIVKGVDKVAAGPNVACAHQTDNALLCWGSNQNGVLGSSPSSFSQRATPAQVPTLPPALDVSIGLEAACALVQFGGGVRVSCWGSNAHRIVGTFGDGIYGPMIHGAAILQDAKKVAVGFNAPLACAITKDDQVACWGRNFAGSLGHPGAGFDNLCTDGSYCNGNPTLVGSPPITATDLVVGYYTVCAKLMDGTLVCWGNNETGQLGRNLPSDGTERPTPAPVLGLSSVTSLSGQALATCAVAGGAAYCWGQNNWGEIGNALAGDVCQGGARCVRAPAKVPLPGNVVQVSCSGANTAARLDDGRLFTWGGNIDGRLGHLPGQQGDLATCGNNTRRCNPNPTQLVLP